MKRFRADFGDFDAGIQGEDQQDALSAYLDGDARFSVAGWDDGLVCDVLWNDGRRDTCTIREES